MEAPACLPYEQLAEIRAERQVPRIFEALWVTGSVEGLRAPTVAIVGTRAASGYGKSIARRFAEELGRAGCTIISGLALGIDTAAHMGALDAGSPTLGVLGGGHDLFFPARNRDLAERMIGAAGAVISPYPPDRRAYPSQFLERNGVVAALADAVVVIEAPARSGALNTAGWAAGRIPVFAVPGDVDRAHVAGCHALIRDGAILARAAQDVLDDLRWTALTSAEHTERAGAQSSPADPLQRRIVAFLADGERSVEEILEGAQAPAAAVLGALSRLELGGAIQARPGTRYALIR